MPFIDLFRFPTIFVCEFPGLYLNGRDAWKTVVFFFLRIPFSSLVGCRIFSLPSWADRIFVVL